VRGPRGRLSRVMRRVENLGPSIEREKKTNGRGARALGTAYMTGPTSRHGQETQTSVLLLVGGRGSRKWSAATRGQCGGWGPKPIRYGKREQAEGKKTLPKRGETLLGGNEETLGMDEVKVISV